MVGNSELSRDTNAAPGVCNVTRRVYSPALDDAGNRNGSCPATTVDVEVMAETG